MTACTHDHIVYIRKCEFTYVCLCIYISMCVYRAYVHSVCSQAVWYAWHSYLQVYVGAHVCVYIGMVVVQ